MKTEVSPEIMIKLLQVPKPMLIDFKAMSPICQVLISLSSFRLLYAQFERLMTSQESLGHSSRLIELIFSSFIVDLLLAPSVFLRVSHMANMCHVSHLPHVTPSLVFFAWYILLSFWNSLLLHNLCCFCSWSSPEFTRILWCSHVQLDQGP